MTNLTYFELLNKAIYKKKIKIISTNYFVIKAK